MLLLTLGIIVFVGVHLVPGFPALRERLAGRLGEGRYMALFSGVALAGLVLIIIGKSAADFVPLWQPPGWGRVAALLITPLAFVLLATAYLPTNIKRFTAHPMLWGVSAWAVAHLLANGDLASLVLFGGLGSFALIDMWLANRRGAEISATRQPLVKDLTALVAGLVAYGIFLTLHPYLFGVAVIA
ncbi:MAG: NnrU family protein [Gammaproteobacteria bacterium]|nr:NnrU family protein [Gammaproteobacteria bacterium]MBA3731234.1 NnrU family protein [Gammaproteobacteria bacterium]